MRCCNFLDMQLGPQKRTIICGLHNTRKVIGLTVYSDLISARARMHSKVGITYDS